jgi:hypothetical protein
VALQTEPLVIARVEDMFERQFKTTKIQFLKVRNHTTTAGCDTALGCFCAKYALWKTGGFLHMFTTENCAVGR